MTTVAPPLSLLAAVPKVYAAGAVSQRLAAAAAGVRFQNLPGSACLAVGVAGSRVRIAFEVEEDAAIDDIERLLEALVDEVRAMRMRDRHDGQGD